MIYLASPYSHADESVREARYRAACRAAAHLIRNGYLVFSPIVHSHPLVEFGLGTDFADWDWYDKKMIFRSSRVYVLMLGGWRDSVGVRREIEIAGEYGNPVRYIEVDDRGIPVV